MLQSSIALVGTTIVFPGCENSETADVAKLAAAVRTDFTRGDVILCNGFIVSRTEAELYKNQGQC